MPFIETALIGDDEGENVLHIGAIRYRVNGSGNLRATLFNLDRTINQVLFPLVMSSTPGKEPVTLSNFKSQRTMLRLETTAINEYASFNRIILFAKEIYTSLPG